MDIELLDNFAHRQLLNAELHQHPYEPLSPPVRVFYIAMLVSPEQRGAEGIHLQRLLEHFGHKLEQGSNRIRRDFGDFRFKMECHQEFTRYKFVFPVSDQMQQDPFADDPMPPFLKSWLTGLPGKILIAMDLPVLPCPTDTPQTTLVERFSNCFNQQALTASQAGRSGGLVISDFMIRSDGIVRMLLFSRSSMPSQNGRLVLRLLEIETYRMLALMALPDAKALLRVLQHANTRLTEITEAIAESGGNKDEELLENLTALASHVEKLVAANYHRLSASRVYFNMITQRLDELHIKSVETTPSIDGFLKRRLEPSRMTCESVSQWLDQLSQRVAHASQLLRTRIDVRHEQQTHELLKAMNNRFHLQLRLQSAAELLSIAIFTYYAVNLLTYVGEEVCAYFSLNFDPVPFKGVAAPIMVGVALLFIWQSRKKRKIE
ncbi:DUF3422 domain-containing protein [Mariprofundus erugo]|uniref:DUF3422 domain-containing protein n=1 Tax=Mariprofundus erugo TaxID=2528639 RepID=A0A5R9GWK6_9PROT|nr:DUF3422 domain-containing protein [Mariprofundus erugo]TLS67494.1 DUF3422 domain-containing protein [Mariprofundus erugo]